MKKLCFLSGLILFIFNTNAQMVQLADGPVFTDTIPGYSKILHMKNYSTMFFHINFNTGINIHVYEPKYHAKTETNIKPAYGNLNAGSIEGIFEINSDAVIMISSKVENTISLYRLIIDGTTGMLKDEKQIASLKLIPLKKADTKMATAWQPGFLVRKDPNSENYAVAITNSFVSDTSKRIEIILYGNDNKEKNRAYYSSKIEKFKYLQFVDMAVIGTDNVAAFIYGYNIKENEGKEGDLILADLNKGEKSVGFTELYYSNDLLIENGMIRYDPQSKQILLLVTANVQSDSNKIHSNLSFIDVTTRKILSNTMLPGEKVQKRYEEISRGKSDYTGIPQNLIINDNRTYTIVFEEMEWGKKNDIPYTVLKNLAVITYDYEAEPKSNYFMATDHDISDILMPSFYQYKREIGGQQSVNGNQYKSSVYISDGRTSCVLLNDSESNGNTDAYYYQLEDKVAVPKRKYVFGKPNDKHEHQSAMFTIYDYFKADNLLITLKTEKEGPHPGVRLVWLQP